MIKSKFIIAWYLVGEEVSARFLERIIARTKQPDLTFNKL